MYTKYFTAIIILPLLLVAAGCCKKKLYCDNNKMNIVISGYSRSESRSLSIKRYKTGEYTKALDSGTLVYNKTLPALKAGEKDTLFLTDYISSAYAFTGIKPGNDWLIYLPALRESYLITTILDNEHRSELISCGDNSTRCLADVAHFSVNNQWMDGSTLWLIKTTNK
jgi:hypothetical protein